MKKWIGLSFALAVMAALVVVTSHATDSTATFIRIDGAPAGSYVKADGSGWGTGVGVSTINTVAGDFIFTGSGVSCTSTTCTFSGTGAGMNFNGLTSGTNSVAAMLVGTGASLGTSGSGTIQATGLTGSITEGQVTGLTTDLAAKVGTTTTVNGHALSANVTVSATDISTGTLPNAQLPSAVSVTSVKATEFITNAEFSNGTCTTAKTIDPVNGNKQKVTLTNGSTCALTFTQPASGTATVQLKITQSAVSTFNGGISGCKWPGGVVPTITQTTGAVDMLSVYLDGTTAYCQIAQAFS
jgi:hypothetical protein